jgi:hypothetical protein
MLNNKTLFELKYIYIFIIVLQFYNTTGCPLQKLSPTVVRCVLKKFWCQLPENGETISPKQVGAMLKTVRINYRTALMSIASAGYVQATGWTMTFS